MDITGLYLMQSYNAKISDFGLAKLGPSASQSHITTRVMGTQGYAAPEYVATGTTMSCLLGSFGFRHNTGYVNMLVGSNRSLVCKE